MKPILEKGLSETFNYEAFVLFYEFDVLSNIIDKLGLFEQLKPKKEIHSISVKSGDKILFIPFDEISNF